ncbi:polyprenyl synthetase family protein [Helcococcus ovis]|uniref:Polyprenyl synthetase family protein n=1 Tax=Helcococcus ovis TaxID=72026 RepID=A0A4R9C034_9FIRM|nr:polyprenyl synthetase family protein [Helcococcus ovis]TFF64916.1 polyprenyl synthetase family protein [Helcococcus ovis]TFF65411.1 polyprenyl synthetase family protein [Helcococcus ovis]TFF68131.1 polyprenyl synthetase family protein [Helcococcus ovis]WNZ01990.1 polyprenyl synthetase family protein [Helcococcus ovis]
MFELYDIRKKEFEKIIINYFDNDKLGAVLNYSIEFGKRIRPLILIETYKMLKDNNYSNEEFENVLGYAISLEMIHNYSLIHDDLPSMDNDNFRRGRETTHYKFGEDMGILAGDSLLNYSYENIFKILSNNNSINYINAAKYLAECAGYQGMIEGQVLDINDNINNIDDLIKMYKNKTCKLIMAATKIPGYISSKSNDILEELELLGFYIGMAFQIQDDLLDVKQDEKINKLTYISFTGKDKAYCDMINYSKKALKILLKYKYNDFLVKLIENLIKRKH